MFGLSLSMYYDASGIVADEWSPNPYLYGVLGLVYPLSLVVVAIYLFRRYRRIGLGGFPLDDPLSRDRLAGSRWWYGIAIGPLLLLLGCGLFFIPYGDTFSFLSTLYLRIIGFVLPAGAGIFLFNIGLAADLSQVRSSVVTWHPGTRRYQLPSLLVPGLIPLIAIIYLGHRHRHIGIP
ncbi:hypothetical protein [Haloparvum sedimenti]|uniref:hypothetical protein n=1 Tax=Haloparvum sedimenti TaxID=1678448 RepID=UPI001146807C|nr:hypothetical protein [Haloparvum sedimenti]